MKSVITVILLSYFTACLSEWVITYPENDIMKYDSPAYLHLGRYPPFSLSGNFSISFPDTSGCSSVPKMESGSETIVVVMSGSCKDSEKARNIQNAGGLGMVIINFAENTLTNTYANYGAEDITIPCVTSYVPVAELVAVVVELLNCSGSCIGSISSDPSPLSSDGYWGFYSLFFLSGYLLNGVFATKKLYHFLSRKEKSSKFGLQFLVLSVSILVATINIFINIDPGATGRGIWSAEVFDSLLTTAWPFSMGCSLAMSFQWQEIMCKMRTNTDQTIFNLKGRPYIISFWIIFVVIFVINMVITIMRGTYATSFAYVVIFNTVIYLTTVFGISIFFLWTGTKLYLIIRKSAVYSNNKVVSNTKKRDLLRMNFIRILCALGWLWFLIACIPWTLNTISSSPGSYLASQFFVFFGLLVVDTCHVHFFVTKTYPRSSSDNTDKTGTADLPTHSSDETKISRSGSKQDAREVLQEIQMADKDIDVVPSSTV